MRKCKVDVCGKKHYGRGYCQAHYAWARRRDFKEVPTHEVGTIQQLDAPDQCTVDGCQRKHSGRGYCEAHRKWTQRRNFDVEPKHKVGSILNTEHQGTCKVDCCEKEYFSRGYCRGHYTWARRRDFEEEPTHSTDYVLDTHNWSPKNIAWATGLFEGEGCITVPDRGYVGLHINSTDKDVLVRFKDIIGGGTLGGPYEGDKESHKDCWYWQCRVQDHVYAILAAMYQGLCERRSQKAREAMVCISEM